MDPKIRQKYPIQCWRPWTPQRVLHCFVQPVNMHMISKYSVSCMIVCHMSSLWMKKVISQSPQNLPLLQTQQCASGIASLDACHWYAPQVCSQHGISCLNVRSFLSQLNCQQCRSSEKQNSQKSLVIPVWIFLRFVVNTGVRFVMQSQNCDPQ